PLAIAAAVMVLSTVALASDPATGQVDEQEISTLRARLEITEPQVAELTETIQGANDEIKTLEQRVAARDIEVELVVDQFAAAVSARDTPVRISQAAAIDSYVQGDPRSQAVLEEIRTLNADQGNQRQRQLYSAVIGNALDQITSAEQRLQDLEESASELLDTLAGLEDELAEVKQERTTALAERAELIKETRALRNRLDWLESLDDRWVLTGALGWDGTTRPALAVKIDNVRAARPQWGVNEADVVWEERVEGGFTRLVAVFHSQQPEVVGPVRSLRTSDPRILINLNQPLLAHSGGNNGAVQTLAISPLIDVGALEHPERYYRQSGRPAPHNLMSSTLDLWDAGGDRGGIPPPVFRFRQPGDGLPDDARPISRVSIPYGETTVDYAWNGSGWVRSQDGAPHTDAEGDPIAPPNVIVQYIGYKPSQADLASPEADVFGEGRALVLLDGHLIDGTWTRHDPNGPTTFRDSAGEFVHLNEGRTWIALPQVDASVVIE
ncbi:MAG: DUF3048 domain-containing protein, partial [Acidimicrobiia bacterium]|nr:DUF3048 domain-containing protein [Acidimicrobiia bacterium]